MDTIVSGTHRRNSHASSRTAFSAARPRRSSGGRA